MSIINDQFSFLIDVCKLITEAEKQGFIVSGGELFRTPEQQDIYIKNGKSKTKNSYHLKRLAIDLNFFKPSIKNEFVLTMEKINLQKIGDYWESLNPKNSWGGNWSSFLDTPHFERKA